FPLHWLLLTFATVITDPNMFLQDTVILGPAVVAFTASQSETRIAWAARLGTLDWMVLCLGYYPIWLLGVNPTPFYLGVRFLMIGSEARAARPLVPLIITEASMRVA